MIKISFKKFSLLLSMNFLIFSMSSCKPYDWQHDNCNWKCDVPFIEIYDKSRRINDKEQTDVSVEGKMIVKDTDYYFIINGSYENNEAFFFEAFAFNLNKEFNLLLHSNIEYKDEKLYFTVVEDGGFDLVGKTLVFSKISCL